MSRLAAALACLLLVLSGAAPVAAAGADAASSPIGATSSPDAAPALQQGGSLSLTVTDGDDPVAGADVTLYRDGEQVLSGETGAEGSLDTGPIENGAYRVEIREPGYYERSVSVTVDGDTARSVALDPGSVELTVDVTDARTGDALADATVDVDAAGTVRTGPDGTQTVRVPVNGEVGLTATKDGYERTALSVAVGESAHSIDLEIARETQLSLSLADDSVAAGDSVTATVTDAYGDPVAGATLLLDGEAVAETDADGTASVPVERGGEHTVRARAGGTLSDPRTLTVEGSSSTATPAETEGGAANGTTTGETGTATATTESGTATPTVTPANDSGDSPFAALPFSVPEIPDFDGSGGPLGMLPPIEGSARIVLVLAGIGAVGLVLSVLREDEL